MSDTAPEPTPAATAPDATEELTEEEILAEGAEEANGDQSNGDQAGEEEEEEMTVDLDALPKMKVAELKDILKALDLPTSGIKTTLIDRIQKHFAEEEVADDTEESELLKENTEPATDPTPVAAGETAATQPQPDFIGIKKAPITAPEVILTDEEKKKQRQVKFGKTEAIAAAAVPKPATDTTKTLEQQKEERAAKFGIDTAKTLADKKAERAARFGSTTGPTKLSVTSEDKVKDSEILQKRAARFNVIEPPSKTAKLDEINVKEKIAQGEVSLTLTSPSSLTLAEKKELRKLKFASS